MYVHQLKDRLYQAREYAYKNLDALQEKMKSIFDLKAVAGKFTSGDKVLAFRVPT